MSIIDEERGIRIFISVLNREMNGLFNEEWGNSTDPDHEPILTRWLYDGVIKESFKESLEQLKKLGELK